MLQSSKALQNIQRRAQLTFHLSQLRLHCCCGLSKTQNIVRSSPNRRGEVSHGIGRRGNRRHIFGGEVTSGVHEYVFIIYEQRLSASTGPASLSTGRHEERQPDNVLRLHIFSPDARPVIKGAPPRTRMIYRPCQFSPDKMGPTDNEMPFVHRGPLIELELSSLSLPRHGAGLFEIDRQSELDSMYAMYASASVNGGYWKWCVILQLVLFSRHRLRPHWSLSLARNLRNTFWMVRC